MPPGESNPGAKIAARAAGRYNNDSNTLMERSASEKTLGSGSMPGLSPFFLTHQPAPVPLGNGGHHG